MEEWKECKLGDIAHFTTGKLNSNAAEDNGIYPFFTCSPETFKINSYAFDTNAILLAGNNAEGNFNIKRYSGKFNAYQRTYVITVDDNTDLIFLFYALKLCLTEFKHISQGTATKFLTAQILNNFEIRVPPLPTQQKIAAILSSLDDKIELNNKINTNLEQQAQALFKNWFVDFEPFGGKMPEGWKEIALENLCTVITKGTTPTTLGKKFTDTGINFIKGESILENHTFDLQKISHIDEDTNTLLKRSIIQPEDILFTIAGTLGRFAMIDESLTPANTNQAVGIIRADKSKISPYFLYSIFIGNWHNDYYTKRIQQAVQANLSLGTIKSLPIIIPDKNNLEKYNNLIEPIFKQMKQLENENIKLSTLRDTLLPKLMNGEIKTNSIIIDKEMKNV